MLNKSYCLVGLASVASFFAACGGSSSRLSTKPSATAGDGASNQVWETLLYNSQWQPLTKSDFYTDPFIQDYSYAGYRRGEVPLPRVERNIINVTASPYNADPGGEQDATEAIQKALDDAGKAGGGVVYLPKGTYRISVISSGLVMKDSNLVLRGDGPDKTFLHNVTNQMHAKSIIKTSINSPSWSTIPIESARTRITADLRTPAVTIPVASTSLFSVGDWVIVRNKITEEWIMEHKEPGWSGMGDQLKGIIYYRQILAIDSSAKTLTIDIPIRYSLLQRDSSMVYLAPKLLEEVGVEDLSIGNDQITIEKGWGEEDNTTQGNAAYDAAGSYVISFDKVRNGWLKNIHTYQPKGNTSGAHVLSNGIKLSQGRSITIAGCDIQKTQYGGSNGNGYTYRIASQEILIQDSKSNFTRHGFVLSGMEASGNVFLRVFDKDTARQMELTGEGKAGGSGSDHHMHFSHSNLFDNCVSENSNFQAIYRPWGSDPKHLLTSAHSVYWNTKGLGKGAKGNDNLIITQQARFGYVIGTQGSRTAVDNRASGDILIKTAPLDRVEGVGLGATLTPSSLNPDQLRKRMAKGNK